MTRTIITLSDDDKAWLNNYSSLKHESVAEIIRTAIKIYRKTIHGNLGAGMLSKTAGLWKARNIDGINYVNKLREEWDDK